MSSRRRVDWDEEIRKTERIRRKGFLMSALSFALVLVIFFGTDRLGEQGAVLGRKIIGVFCFTVAVFLVRGIVRRRKRLGEEREEKADGEGRWS